MKMSSVIELVKEKFTSERNYHLGHVFMDSMTRNNPERICTIDGATDEQETNASVLARSIALARCFRRLGLKPGDVLVLAGSLHLHIHIPYFAALMEGLPIAAVDPSLKYDEVKALFKTSKPKIAFCQNASFETFSRAAKDLGLDIKIVTFDEGECTLFKFMDIYSGNESTDDYQVADFDTDKIYAWLVSTSGTTGLPKLAAFKHHVVIENIIQLSNLSQSTDEKSKKIVAHFSSIQWISSYYSAIHGPIQNDTKLQSSRSEDIGHLVDVINKYKPGGLVTSPATASRILRHEKHCDLTCFDFIIVTGDKSPKDLMSNLKSRMNPRAFALEGYGQTETVGPLLVPHPMSPIGSCGVPLPHIALQLVDPESGVVIKEPNVTGELWYKGMCFTEYYKDSEETAKAFSEDGWYKTGDLLYRDEKNNYFFVERMKLLIKYRDFHVSPPEIENLILTLDGVQEVCVTSVPHPEDGQLPVACVVRRPGCDVTAHELKQLVAENLSVHKQLLGGVVFLDEMPMTSTGKVHRSVLQKMVLTANRE